MRKLNQLITAVATTSVLALVTPLAFAGSGAPVLPSVDPWLSVNTSGDLIPAPGGANDGSNDFAFSGSNTSTGQFAVDWSLTVNPDPFIDGAITITNLSSSAQNFTVNLNLPVSPSFSPGVMSGSIDATVFDANNSGSATLQPQAGNIYFGRIDGSNALLLFAQVLSCNGAGCSINSSDSQTSIPVAGVNTSIGTKLMFNLSGNDKVTFSTHFEVNPVPLPASIWLMSSAVLGLFGMRRRR